MRYKKRKDGRYCVQLSTGQFNESGIPKRINIYARTEAELRDKVAQARINLNQGLIALDSSTCFGEYSQRWLLITKANRSIKTRKMYENALKHTEQLDRLKLKDIKQSHIQAQINEYCEFPRLCEQIKLAIKQVLDSAVLDGIIGKNVCVGIELPRHIKKQKRALTRSEREAVKNADLPTKHRAFINLLYYTGMRPAEVYALTWSDINFRLEQIKVCKSLAFDGEKPVLTYPKTDSGVRTIEAPHELFKSLMDLKKERETDCLIVFNADGEYMHLSAYDTLWNQSKRKIEEYLGYRTEITAYYFRHNYATMLYYSNVSIKEAVRLLGHSDIQMIMKVYSHLDSQRENTREKINAINF